MDCKIYQSSYPAQPPKKRRSENNGDDVEDRDFNPSMSGPTDLMAYSHRVNRANTIETSILREKLEAQDGPIDFSVKNDKESFLIKRRKSLSPVRVVEDEYKSGSNNVDSHQKSDQERQDESWKNFDNDRIRQEQLVGNSNIPSHNEQRNKNDDEHFERRRSLIHVPHPNKSIVMNRNDHLHGTNGLTKSMLPELESYLKKSGNLRDPTANFTDMLRSGSSANGLMALSANDFNSRAFQNYHPALPFPGLYSPGVPPALTNGHQPFFGTPDLSADRKISKASRPFKMFENEILGYDPQFPYNSVSTFMHNRLIESSPQHSPVSNAGNNHSPTHQEPSTSTGSNGSRVASISPNGFSDDSQQSNSNQLNQLQQQQLQQQQPDSCQSMRRRGQRIPDDKKDAAYLEKRRKNNEAAKRSRDARRRKEDQMALRAKHLMDRNKLLEFQVASMEKVNKILELEIDQLKRASCHQKCIIDSLQNELEKMRRGFIMNGSRNGERVQDGAPESPGL